MHKIRLNTGEIYRTNSSHPHKRHSNQVRLLLPHRRIHLQNTRHHNSSRMLLHICQKNLSLNIHTQDNPDHHSFHTIRNHHPYYPKSLGNRCTIKLEWEKQLDRRLLAWMLVTE